MDGSIALARGQRNRLRALCREDPSPCVRLRAHIILLLADGHPWALVCAVLFCSTATVARWKSRFEAGGVAALLEEKRGRAGGRSPRRPGPPPRSGSPRRRRTRCRSARCPASRTVKGQ